MKLYITDDRTINFIQFKNIKIAIDKNTCVFISNIDKNNGIKIHKSIGEKLLKKFKVYDWDSLDYNENLFHIKFLVKYSPILPRNLIQLNSYHLVIKWLIIGITFHM